MVDERCLWCALICDGFSSSCGVHCQAYRGHVCYFAKMQL